MISGDRSLLQGKKSTFWYTLEELSRHWERVDIICPRIAKGELRRANETRNSQLAIRNFPENVFFHPSPWPLLLQSRWIAKKGKELIAAHHHDVMTAHEYPPFYNGRGAERLARATGVPYALEIHHVVGYPVASSLAERIGRWMSFRYLARDARDARAVRIVNREVRDVLMRMGVPEEKIAIVPSFYLDVKLLAAESPRERRYDVVTCARLVENKGLCELLTAIASISEVSLLIIGDGPLRPTLEGRAKALGIATRVTFAGWLPSREDVVSALRSARVFVMNSKSEGGPRSALEAMACGLPVIATRVGVMPEVLVDGVNGIFTDGSPDDLRTKIVHLLEHETVRHQLGTEAKKILDRFERQRLIRDYADFLKNLSGRGWNARSHL
ncbi:glycosyltransferase [Candidatus Peregrinibacteria bacterium]|nr:glycosyltransferase [Candidatus Peregrinibacteria bacterium]